MDLIYSYNHIESLIHIYMDYGLNRAKTGAEGGTKGSGAEDALYIRA
jgi:hypothetical protein